jgi:hypothetical protein
MADPGLISAIVRFARACGLPPDLLVALAYAESELDAFAIGDNGTSCGAFQAHVPAHGHDCAHWQGVDGAQRIMAVMRDRWLRAYRQHDGASAWSAAPEQFLRIWWPDAQGADPAGITEARCAEAVREGRRAYEEWRSMIVPVDARITQRFGENPNNGLYGPAGHTGIDFGCPMRTPVRAVQGGRVTFADWLFNANFPGDRTRGYGIAVIVRDSAGREWLYGHNDELTVALGQQVNRGDQLALSGATGATGAILTGGPPEPHLHLELRVGGTPVDPLPLLDAAEPASSAAAGRLSVIEDGWRLRAGPSTDSAILVEGLRAGETVDVLAQGWLHVRARGVEGFIRADGLRYGDAPSFSGPVPGGLAPDRAIPGDRPPSARTRRRTQPRPASGAPAPQRRGRKKNP